MLANEERQVELGDKVLEYKKKLIKNQIKNAGLKIEFIEGNKFIRTYQIMKKTLMLFTLLLEKICLF